jgi:hypothetical protein
VVVALLGHALLANALVVVLLRHLLLGHLLVVVLLANLLMVVLLVNILADVLAVVGLLALDNDLRLLHNDLHVSLTNLDPGLLDTNLRLTELNCDMLRRARTFR